MEAAKSAFRSPGKGPGRFRTREKLSLVCTVTHRGRASWMITDGAFNHVSAVGTHVPVRTKAESRAAADEHMRFTAADRDRVRSHLRDPIVKHAA